MTNQLRTRHSGDPGGARGQTRNPRSALVRASLARSIDSLRWPLRDHTALAEQRLRLGISQIMGQDLTVETLLVLDALAESREALMVTYSTVEPPACAPDADRWALERVVSNTILALRHEARQHESDRAVLELLRPYGGQSSGIATSRRDASPEEEARVLAVYAELSRHQEAKTAWCGLSTDALGQACADMSGVIERWGLGPLLA